MVWRCASWWQRFWESLARVSGGASVPYKNIRESISWSLWEPLFFPVVRWPWNFGLEVCCAFSVRELTARARLSSERSFFTLVASPLCRCARVVPCIGIDCLGTCVAVERCGRLLAASSGRMDWKRGKVDAHVADADVSTHPRTEGYRNLLLRSVLHL